MDMSMEHCWDCGSPLRDVLLLIAISVALVAFSTFLFRTRQTVVRTVGRVFLVLCGFWYFFSSGGIVRFGISWPADAQHRHAVADLAVLFAWYGITAVVVVGVCRAARKSARTVA